jgi:hypothetical protein
MLGLVHRLWQPFTSITLTLTLLYRYVQAGAVKRAVPSSEYVTTAGDDRWLVGFL